jgi:hypothetical protein
MGGQIAGDGDKDVPTLVGVAPLAELADARLQDLMGVETLAQQCRASAANSRNLGSAGYVSTAIEIRYCSCLRQRRCASSELRQGCAR